MFRALDDKLKAMDESSLSDAQLKARQDEQERGRVARISALPLSIQRLVVDWRKRFFERYTWNWHEDLMSKISEAFEDDAEEIASLLATKGWQEASEFVLAWYERAERFDHVLRETRPGPPHQILHMQAIDQGSALNNIYCDTVDKNAFVKNIVSVPPPYLPVQTPVQRQTPHVSTEVYESSTLNQIHSARTPPAIQYTDTKVRVCLSAHMRWWNRKRAHIFVLCARKHLILFPALQC
jgi:hypothetical protein